MRQVQVAEMEGRTAELVAEAEAGEPVTLMRDGRAVAHIAPFAEGEKPVPTEEERTAAREWLKNVRQEGFDMGGFKIGSRDDVHDRSR